MGNNKICQELFILASGASAALSYVGVAISVVTEITGHIKQNENNKKFAELTENLCELIEECCDSIIKLAQNSQNNYKEFLDQFAPQLSDLQKYLDEKQNTINQQKERNEFFRKWKEQAEDAELLDS